MMGVLQKAPRESAHGSRGALAADQPQGWSLPSWAAALIERGIVERRMVFPEDGPSRRVERWEAPLIEDAQTLAKLEEVAGELAAWLEPADRGWLLARVLALLSHFRSDRHAASVEQCIADDWAEDLGEFPAWAIEEAARHWRRTRRFRPQINEMRGLCEEAIRDVREAERRIASIVMRARRAQNPMVSKIETVLRSTFRGSWARVPVSD
ncbi:hypothetical protein [Sabulicella glaciei]|uniref:Uncharacterized protein n=1 Tax=Sabulicella glaciei TaxID=2984948 RepID=A0ABT3P1K3_9PROT|nr:hypothetical protein [Roseococcus sp. MDT2-1-1]MCW8088288.1 hypothetical protein [Roseococcus sp. MDT2-1-1]